MSESLLDDFSSLRWWVSVVAAGILVNIVAAYLLVALDRLGSKASIGWATRTAAKADQRARLVARLREDPEARIMWAFAEMRSRVWAVICLLVGLAGMGLSETKAGPARWILFAVSVVTLLLAMRCLQNAVNDNGILHESMWAGGKR